jgi:hypothetical protein
MAAEGWLPVRRAMLTALKADAGLADLVPAERIYPQSPPGVPAWPFVKCGPPAGVPIQADGVDGDNVRVAFHSFARPRQDEAGETIETAEDHADRIGRAVMRALHRQRLDLGGGASAAVRRIGYRLLQDPDEDGAYHHVAEFRVRVIA